MTTNKARRGRPKRAILPAPAEKQSTHDLITFENSFPGLDIKQPLIINRKHFEEETGPSAFVTPPPNDEDHVEQEIQSDPKKIRQVDYACLPKVSYSVCEPDEGLERGDPDSESTFYDRPENHYIRYKEPTEDELFETIEYDMDEMDKAWLEVYNQERKKDHKSDVSPYLFESIMDRLEKEWFRLIQGVATPSYTEDVVLPEDSACAVCDDTEVENSNAIVFCDGCNVAVHQDCYGIPYIPEGQWLCKRCQISPDKAVSCVFCPNEGGAFKQTTDDLWGHLVCALWIPEVSLKSTVYMEPIDYIDEVPKSRWKLSCIICKKKQGACIQCNVKNCFSAFHVTCAKAVGLSMKMKLNTSPNGGIILNAYCDKHTPRESDDSSQKGYTEIQSNVKKQVQRGRGRGRGRGRPNARTVTPAAFDMASNKMLRAHGQNYITGAPIPPNVTLSEIDNMSCLLTSSLRKRNQLVTAVAHYWSLKRESRRGAPLLKRLQLEPWAVTNTIARINNGDERLMTARKEFIGNLRGNLDKVRMLTEQVQKRERLKLESLKRQKEYLEMILYPIEHVIRSVLKDITTIDGNEYFIDPVTEEDAPDYTSIIEKPMCFSIIEEKLGFHEYTEFDQFKEDVALIWKNCMTYNDSGTKYHRIGGKLKKQSDIFFEAAEKKLSSYKLEQGFLDVSINPSLFDYTAEEEEIEIADEMSTESPVSSLPVQEPTRSRGRQPGFKLRKSSDSSGETSSRRIATRRVTIQGSSENYTIHETGSKQSSIKQWIMQQPNKKIDKQPSKKLDKKPGKGSVSKATAVQRESQSSTIDIGVQTDEYLLLSLLQNFKVLEQIHRLEDEKQKDQGHHNDPRLIHTAEQEDSAQGVSQNTTQEAQSEPAESDSTQDVNLNEMDYTDATDDEEVVVTDETEEGTSVESRTAQESTKTGIAPSQGNNVDHEQSESSSDTPNEITDINNKQPRYSNEKSDQSNNKISSSYVRATRSRGLSANEEEFKKRKRVSKESRLLHDSLLHLEKRIEKFKTDNTRYAPVGWAYLESDEDDGTKSGEVVEAETPDRRPNKIRKVEQTSLDDFEHEEIVWARVIGYPSHPAKLLKEIDEELGVHKAKRSKSFVLVEFLKVPDNHKWGWVQPAHIAKFGDTESDKARLNEVFKIKGSSRTVRMLEAKEGYQYACSLIGKDDCEAVLETVFNDENLRKKKKAKPPKRN